MARKVNGVIVCEVDGQATKKTKKKHIINRSKANAGKM